MTTSSADIKNQISSMLEGITQKSQDIKKGVNKILLQGALLIERQAKLNLAKWLENPNKGNYHRTGNLMRSITHYQINGAEEFQVIVGADFTGSQIGEGSGVYYAKYVEFGTYLSKTKGGMRPRPYMMPAYNQYRPQIMEALKKQTEGGNGEL